MILRHTDHRPTPWRNGRGTTLEIARVPAAGDADWRLSLADVSASAPFSVFPDVERSLTVVDGEGLVLDVAGERRELGPFTTTRFAGEADVQAEPAGAVRVLNLMTRRGRATGSVECVRVDGALTVEPVGGSGALLVVVLDGAATVLDGEAEAVLEPHDVLAVDDEVVALAGTGVLAVVRVETTGGRD